MASGSTRDTSLNWCLPGTVMKSALIANKLSICSLNSQSICARKLCKLDELRQIAQSSAIDVICVTETWMNNKTDDSLLAIDGYNIIRNDREGRLGGGILIYIKQGIHYRLLDKSIRRSGVSYCEYAAVEIVLKSEKLFLVAMYNPPELNCVDSINYLLSNYGTNYETYFLQVISIQIC